MKNVAVSLSRLYHLFLLYKKSNSLKNLATNERLAAFIRQYFRTMFCDYHDALLAQILLGPLSLFINKALLLGGLY